jgi:acyl-coenzyme A thioesterase 13
MSLTDTLGSLAIASKGHFMTGVSTDIGTSFIRPAGSVGDTLYGKAVVTAMGKSLAYTRVDFMNDKGTLVAYGRMSSLYHEPQIRRSYTVLPHADHTKYIGKSSSHEVRPGLSFLPLSLFSPSLLRIMWSSLKTERTSVRNLPEFVQSPSPPRRAQCSASLR